MENKLASYTLKFAPRVLSMLDKGEFAPSYGCFDRNFWHYKTVTDYPSATYQQGALFLALLYTSDIPDNYYYKQEEILKLCLASIDFWASIQNKDGSFNEWYPNEHSQVATAFTLYAITESLLLLRNHIDEEVITKYLKSIHKSAYWLGKNPDTQVINHTAGALCAIYNSYLLSGDIDLLKYVDKCITVLSDYQSPEGWFNEYYGADIGYTSVSVDYLAKYYHKSGDERVLNMLDRSVSFIAFFMHPDGSSGGEYGNRNTKYIMPAGIHIMAKYFEEARYILHKFYYGLEKGTQPGLGTFDDRYFMFFFASNYLEASIISETLSEQELEFSDKKYAYFSHEFSQAGIVVKKTPKYYFVCNFKKGGIIKLYSNNGELLYSDSSYFIKFQNDKLASSQKLTANLDYYIDNSDEENVEINFQAPFIWVNTSLPLTKILIPFRIFNYTLGYITSVMNYFNKYLKNRMIAKPKIAPLFIKRHIMIKNNMLIIEDAITKKTKDRVKSIELPAAKTNLHVPSSRYAIYYDIKEFTGIDSVCVEEMNKVNITYVKTQVEIK